MTENFTLTQQQQRRRFKLNCNNNSGANLLAQVVVANATTVTSSSSRSVVENSSRQQQQQQQQADFFELTKTPTKRALVVVVIAKQKRNRKVNQETMKLNKKKPLTNNNNRLLRKQTIKLTTIIAMLVCVSLVQLSQCSSAHSTISKSNLRTRRDLQSTVGNNTSNFHTLSADFNKLLQSSNEFKASQQRDNTNTNNNNNDDDNHAQSNDASLSSSFGALSFYPSHVQANRRSVKASNDDFLDADTVNAIFAARNNYLLQLSDSEPQSHFQSQIQSQYQPPFDSYQLNDLANTILKKQQQQQQYKSIDSNNNINNLDNIIGEQNNANSLLSPLSPSKSTLKTNEFDYLPNNIQNDRFFHIAQLEKQHENNNKNNINNNYNDDDDDINFVDTDAQLARVRYNTINAADSSSGSSSSNDNNNNVQDVDNSYFNPETLRKFASEFEQKLRKYWNNTFVGDNSNSDTNSDEFKVEGKKSDKVNKSKPTKVVIDDSIEDGNVDDANVKHWSLLRKTSDLPTVLLNAKDDEVENENEAVKKHLADNSMLAASKPTSAASLLGKYLYAPTNHFHFDLSGKSNTNNNDDDNNNNVDGYKSTAGIASKRIAVSSKNQNRQSSELRNDLNEIGIDKSVTRTSLLLDNVRSNDIFFLFMVMGICATATTLVLAAGIFVYKFQVSRKQNLDDETPTYGVVGPNNLSVNNNNNNNSSSGDLSNANGVASLFMKAANVNGGLVFQTKPSDLDKTSQQQQQFAKINSNSGADQTNLNGTNNTNNNNNPFAQHNNINASSKAVFLAGANNAAMYHFQRQKQQMITNSTDRSLNQNASASDLDSEDDNDDEENYTVYECPGLASTHNMEIKNPLFNDDQTPINSPPYNRK